jgi:ankyrin repeat protein
MDLLAAVASGSRSDVEELLDRGLDVNYVNEFKQSALMIACKRGDVAIVNLLISKNANVHLEDFQNRTAAVYAAEGSSMKNGALVLRNNLNVLKV